MKLLIQGNNIEVTEAIHNHVKQKLEKAVKHFNNLTSKVDVHLSVANHSRAIDNHQAEVTVFANGTVIRAQESSGNLYASIDMVADKIARQLRKYKEKQLGKKGRLDEDTNDFELDEPATDLNLVTEKTPQLPQEVVRTKYFSMPPMSVQEALEQLQIIDHDFYMFFNKATNQINVIYSRNHGGYGVIQPRPGENIALGNNSNGHSEQVNRLEVTAIG